MRKKYAVVSPAMRVSKAWTLKIFCKFNVLKFFTYTSPYGMAIALMK